MLSYMVGLLVFVLGMCLGSFLNVVIHRLPKDDLSIGSPRRSLCPGCGAGIHWYDNIPVASYLALGGRGRACKMRISPRYPLIELMVGLLVLAVYLKYGLSLRWGVNVILVMSLIAVTFIEQFHDSIVDLAAFEREFKQTIRRCFSASNVV